MVSTLNKTTEKTPKAWNGEKEENCQAWESVGTCDGRGHKNLRRCLELQTHWASHVGVIILPSFLFLWENTDFRSKIHWATYNTKLTPAASMFPQGDRLQACSILLPISFSNLLNCTATSRTRADEISKRNAVTGE